MSLDASPASSSLRGLGTTSRVTVGTATLARWRPSACTFNRHMLPMTPTSLSTTLPPRDQRCSYARKLLATCGVMLSLSTGCITVSPSQPPSLQSLFKPPVTQASYEETFEEIPAEPENPEQLKIAYARWMEEYGRHEEARAQYGEVIEAEPKNVDAILGLARLDQMRRRTDEAEKGFLKAVRLEPDSARTQSALGQFYATQQRWSDAVPPLRKALLTDPANRSYRYDLAVALAESGDVQSSLPHFVETVGDAEAHYNVALILLRQGQELEAERHLTLAVNKKPNFAQARKWLAEVRGESESAAQPTVLPASGAHTSSGVQSAAGQQNHQSSASPRKPDGHKLPDTELPVIEHHTSQASPLKPQSQPQPPSASRPKPWNMRATAAR